MRSTVLALVTATTAICFFGAAGSASAGQGETVCTWGGTPAAPTGVATFSPGITNTPSTGPIQFTATGVLAGSGCTGKLTYTGYFEPGHTCALNTAFHAKATGLPHVVRVEGQPGVAGTAVALLYDVDGNVVGSDQAQFLTTLANESDPGFMSCGAPQGLTEGFWSDTVELFASR